MLIYDIGYPLTQATIYFKQAATPSGRNNIPYLNPGECKWTDGHSFAKNDHAAMAKIFYSQVSYEFRVRSSLPTNLRVGPIVSGRAIDAEAEEEVRKFMRTVLFGDEYFIVNLKKEPSETAGFLDRSMGELYEIDNLQDRP